MFHGSNSKFFFFFFSEIDEDAERKQWRVCQHSWFWKWNHHYLLELEWQNICTDFKLCIHTFGIIDGFLVLDLHQNLSNVMVYCILFLFVSRLRPMMGSNIRSLVILILDMSMHGFWHIVNQSYKLSKVIVHSLTSQFYKITKKISCTPPKKKKKRVLHWWGRPMVFRAQIKASARMEIEGQQLIERFLPSMSWWPWIVVSIAREGVDEGRNIPEREQVSSLTGPPALTKLVSIHPAIYCQADHPTSNG